MNEQQLIIDIKSIEDLDTRITEEIKEKKPVRRFNDEVKRDMRENKEFLRVDFYKKCCYCDDSDVNYGGINGFHVEHFAPKSKFPELCFNYSNLLYVCPLCNRAKWNKWPSDKSTINVVNEKGFLDPCYDEYYEHLKRLKNGSIVYKSNLGKYIFFETKLYLQKHAIHYKIFKLEQIKDRINYLISIESDLEKINKLRELKEIVTDDFFRYYNVLKD